MGAGAGGCGAAVLGGTGRSPVPAPGTAGKDEPVRAAARGGTDAAPPAGGGRRPGGAGGSGPPETGGGARHRPPRNGGAVGRELAGAGAIEEAARRPTENPARGREPVGGPGATDQDGSLPGRAGLRGAAARHPQGTPGRRG